MDLDIETIIKIGQFIQNSPNGKQFDAPIEFDQFTCVARTLEADQTFWSTLLPDSGANGIAFVLETRLGAISCGLAPYFAKVISWHKSAKVARLTELYAQRLGLCNIDIVIAQNIKQIALQNGSIDAVVFFGPSRDLTRQWEMNISSLLSATFDHVKGALSDSAVALIGENNQWSYRADSPEPGGNASHAGVALPLLRKKMQTNFPNNSVYVCSFSLSSSQSPMPDFLRADAASDGLFIPKSQAASVKDKLLNLPAMRMVWPSFLSISTKKQRSSLAEELICQKRIASKVGWAANESTVIKRIIAGNSGTSIVIGGPANRDSADVVLRMPSRPSSLLRCQVNAKALTRLADSALSGFVPRLLCHEKYQGREYTIETRSVGYEIGYGTRELDRMISKACSAVGELHFGTTKFTHMEDPQFECLVRPYFADIRSFCSDDASSRLNKLEESLRRAITGKAVALGWVHGDFKVSNMLFDRSGVLTAIIDWDGFSESGFQVFDYLTLLIYKIANERKVGLADAYIQNILPWELNNCDATLVTHPIQQLMVNDESFLLVRIAFWFALLADRLGPVCKFHPEWHRRFVTPVLPRMEAFLQGTHPAR